LLQTRGTPNTYNWTGDWRNCATDAFHLYPCTDISTDNQDINTDNINFTSDKLK